MQDKKIQLAILIGALLLTGLFFVWPSRQQSAVLGLKPSQLDFSRGNRLGATDQTGSLETSRSGTSTNDGKNSTTPPTAGHLNPTDQEKWKTFTAVLESRNDNDPRIDQQLKDLSPEMHRTLEETYSKLPAEDRNGRGLVAFLIARDLKSPSDLEFLSKIYQESPCLSFDNCSSEAAPDPHFDGINQTSLNYPQLAGLYQIQRKLEAQPSLLQNPEMKARIAALLREARQFPADAIQKRAEEMQTRYGL